MRATLVRPPMEHEKAAPSAGAATAPIGHAPAFATSGPVCTACQDETPCPACAAKRADPPWPGWAQPSMRGQHAADPLEREADAIAAVATGLRPPGPVLPSWRFLRSAAPEPVAQRLAGGGQPLEAGLRRYFEHRLGHDFGGVRVHDSPGAAATAQAIGARAYAHGSDLVFAPGAFRPHEAEGRRLIAHELAHTLQQGAAPRRGEGTPAATPAPRAVAREPQSLTATLDPALLSDAALLAEAMEIRDWLAENPPEAEQREAMAQAVAGLLAEAVRRGGAPAEPMEDVAGPSDADSAGPEDPDVMEGFVGPLPLVPRVAPPPVTTPPVTAPPVVTPGPGPGIRPIPPMVVPRPPVAVPILVAILILLWPNDSIVSGEEERRLLEEARRAEAARQQAGQQQGAPAPQAGRRNPNQTCDDDVLDRMQREMHAFCDRIPGESCSPSKVSPKKLAKRPCSQIRLRILALEECLRRRQEIQDVCFGGIPDERHIEAMNQLRSGLDQCRALEAVNCAPGHPMADL